MEQLKKSRGRKLYGAVAVFLAVNLAAVIIIGVREAAVINNRMQQRAEDTAAQFESVMENYRHSFRLLPYSCYFSATALVHFSQSFMLPMFPMPVPILEKRF